MCLPLVWFSLEASSRALSAVRRARLGKLEWVGGKTGRKVVYADPFY